MIGVLGVQTSRIARSRDSHPLFWYPSPKTSQMHPDDFPTRYNINEDLPSERKIHLKRRNSRSYYKPGNDDFFSNLFRKKPKGQDLDAAGVGDTDMKSAIRNSIRQTIPNFEDDSRFYNEDITHQTTPNNHKDASMSFLKKDKVRQTVPDSYKEDSNSIHNGSNANGESDYETDYSYGHPKDKQKPQPTSPDDSMYEFAQDDDAPRKLSSKDNAPVKSLETKRDADLSPQVAQKLEQSMREELDKIIKDNSTCSDCAKVKMENEQLKAELVNETYKHPEPSGTLSEDVEFRVMCILSLLASEENWQVSGYLVPAYACDQWFFANRTCWLDRNIGDTVTFVLGFTDGPKKNSVIQWRQEFHLKNSNKRRIYNIDSEKPMWNVVIGSRGHELRLSPITEIDIDSNSFSAVLVSERKPSVHNKHKVNFRIRLIPIDQGLIYPGETLILNMRRTTLPQAGLCFKWYMEGESEISTLPSNMRLSPSGDVLFISELRQEQEGNITCSVFTNKGFFATKQRYMLKEIRQLNSVLVNPTPKSHSRKKRSPDPDDNVEQALVNLETYDPDKFYKKHGYELPVVISYIDEPVDESQDTDETQPQFDYIPNGDLSTNLKRPNEDGFEYKSEEIVENNKGEGGGNSQFDTKTSKGQIEIFNDDHKFISRHSNNQFNSGTSNNQFNLGSSNSQLSPGSNNNQLAFDQISHKANYNHRDPDAGDVSHFGRVNVIDNSENRESNSVNDVPENQNLLSKIDNNNFEKSHLEKGNLESINRGNSDLRSSNNGNNHFKINDFGSSNLQHSSLRNSNIENSNNKERINIKKSYPESSNNKVNNIEGSDLRSNLEKGNFLNRNLLSSNSGHNNPFNDFDNNQEALIRNQIPNGDTNVGVAENDEVEDTNRNNNKIENIIMEVDRRPESALARAEDSISKLMASCTSDLQCAPDAICVQGSGFCRCTLGFQGNGLFCWAEVQLRSNGRPLRRETVEEQCVQNPSGPQNNANLPLK